ncbi:hypothetical protein TIFTF001_038749 [Ficus carica]|uniref:MULE transposase domain-containing protein n=1 Tax=Ficus carica TaxID=3494 RepID=A0AA88E9G7_FICCA|nr:hypothetical protein TIFTF001_038749 [Ficus carica]
MKGILVPEIATYVGLIELVRSAIEIRGPAKIIVMRYGVEPGMPLVRIQCDTDVKFYIQLKKNNVHVLRKFPITIDVFDESAAEAMPPEVGESNYIDVQCFRKGVQSDEAMQHVDDSNLIILPPPPYIPSPTIGLDLHTEYGIEKQHQVLNNDLCTAHGDCNAGELNVVDDARQSNKNSIAASIGAHYIANNTTSQSVNVPSSDSVSGSVVVADYTPVTMHINCIFENKKLLQYHLHHDAMSKHYQFKVKRSASTLLHVICINNKGCPWQLRATRMRGSELFVVKRYDDVHTCSIEIFQGHHRQAKSWMIGECVKAKYLDLTNTSYRPREIMRDMQAEFEVSFNYLRAWRGMETALTSLRGDDAESYNATSKHGWLYCRPVIVVDGSALKAKFGGMLLAACGHDTNGCIFPLAFDIVPSESNKSWKWFFEKLRNSIGTRESLAIVADKHKGIEYAANLVYPDAAFVHSIGNAEGWDVPEEARSQIANPPNTKRGPGRPRVRRILSQGEEHEPIRCSRCNGYGHNRQTCTNSVPLRVRPTIRSQQSFTTPSS